VLRLGDDLSIKELAGSLQLGWTTKHCQTDVVLVPGIAGYKALHNKLLSLLLWDWTIR